MNNHEHKKKLSQRRGPRSSASVCVQHVTEDMVRRVKRTQADEMVRRGKWKYCDKSTWRKRKKS